VILGFWPFVSDLHTGAVCCGSGEQALLTAACGQMSRHYGLISGIPAGIADSKMPDAHPGNEKGLNHVATANSGANLMYEAGGMVASLMGFSLESLAMDNDSVAGALRTVRGIEVNDDTLSVNVIREVCVGGSGHFRAHSQTIERMEQDYVYPRLPDRMSPGQWKEKGNQTALDRAIIVR
jgi:trimethylamine---corrinoid protein Co-methyltransferase